MTALIETMLPMRRTQAHIEETHHAVQSMVYTQENRRITLASCSGCDFKDWRLEYD